VAELNELIGCRVALRHRVPGPPDRELLTDSVGDLREGAAPDEVRVHTRRGIVTVARASVVAVREIPPAQPRRPSWAAVARLESICADAWPPMTSAWLGQWRLRAAGGFTARANSALAVGDPGIPTADALARVRDFAAQHAIPPRLQVPTGSPWHRAVTGHGWTRDTEHPAGDRVLVMVGPLAQLASPPELGEVTLSVAAEPDQEWWRVAGDAPVTEGQRHVLGGVGLDDTGFGLASIGGQPVGAVRAVVLEEHLCLARLTVLPQYRRRGLASALLDEAARWAVVRGARWCAAQIAEQNHAAIGLYRKLGLRPHHEYEYLRPGDEPAAIPSGP
jgi:N-acetylglutamate synthase